MKQIREYLTTKVSKSKIKATDKTIKQIVKEEMDKYGHDCDLNHVDVSEVTDMDSLFCCYKSDLGRSYSDLNPDISEWDVSNVKNMTWTFCACQKFDCDLSKWNVSNVTNMKRMFKECENFNCNISEWDVSNVKYMGYMFQWCIRFNQDISKWNVSNVINMDNTFCGCESFNQDISKWDVSNVIYRYLIFDYCPIEEEYKPHFKTF